MQTIGLDEAQGSFHFSRPRILWNLTKGVAGTWNSDSLETFLSVSSDTTGVPLSALQPLIFNPQTSHAPSNRRALACAASSAWNTLLSPFSKVTFPSAAQATFVREVCLSVPLARELPEGRDHAFCHFLLIIVS